MKAFSWQMVFLVFGISGILWIIPWIIFAADSPQTSKWMTEKEKDLIADGLVEESNDKSFDVVEKGEKIKYLVNDDEDEFESTYSKESDKKISIPWKTILSSKPVYAVIECQFTTGYTFYVS